MTAVRTAARVPAMSEAELLAAVRQLARLTGWLVYHTHDSRRSEPGFPDLALANHRQGRVIFAELKTATGRITAKQEEWLAALASAGCETALWRPADLPDIARVLRKAAARPAASLDPSMPRREKCP